MNRRFLFFVNPISGTKSRMELEKKIISFCNENNVHFEILFTSSDGKYPFLKDKIISDNISDVIVCGGDGSIGPVVSALIGVSVSVGIIPRGSGNGLATAAGIPGNVDKALAMLLAGSPQCIDAFTVNGNLSCQISGLGFDAVVAHEFAKQKKRGLSTYIKEFIKNFLKVKAYPFEILIDGEVVKELAYCICVANSNQYGNNLKIAPRASLSDGLLDIVIMKKSTKVQAIYYLGMQIFFGKVKHVSDIRSNVLYYQASSLTVQNPGYALLHIDGEPVNTYAQLEIKILPAAFKLIMRAGKK